MISQAAYEGMMMKHADQAQRIAELEMCVALLFNLIMEADVSWDTRGKAQEVVRRAALPKSEVSR